MRRAREVTRVRDGGPRLYGVYRAYANLDPGLDKVSLRSTRACSLWFTYASELVARNAEDAEVPERGLECIQRVVLGRGDSEGRHVDEQDDPAVVRRPVERLPAVHVQDLVVVDRAIAGQRVVAQRLAAQNIFNVSIYLYLKIESLCLCAHLTLYPATDCTAATGISGVSGR